MAEPVLIRPDRPAPAWLFRAWELLAPRLPRAVIRLGARFLQRLPRGSRARRRYLLATAAIAWDATARTRFDLVLPLWDVDCEWHWDDTFQAIGFDEVYRRHDGVRRSLTQWSDVWDERSFTLRGILDGGDTLVFRMTAAGRGIASGASIEQDYCSVVRLDPLIVDFRNFADDAEALRESGFS